MRSADLPSPAARATVPVCKPDNADLGRALRQLRSARRVTIEDLAFAAVMHPTYLSSIERGERNPTWVKLCALADALGVSTTAVVRNAETQASITARVREIRQELSPGSDQRSDATPSSR